MTDTDALLSAKRRGYGTTSLASACVTSASQRPPVVVRHTVLKCDTLSGLAVQYNASVADIKRANKLWNNESLAFRETVNIPVYKDRSSDSSSQSSMFAASPRSSADMSDIDISVSPSGGAVTANHMNSSLGTVNSMSSSLDTLNSLSSATDTISSLSLPAENTLKDFSSSTDFFARLDKSMTRIKKKVESHAAASAEYLEDDVLYDGASTSDTKQHNGTASTSRTHPPNSRSKSKSNATKTEDLKVTPDVVTKHTRSKKKMAKHQKHQIELLTL